MTDIKDTLAGDRPEILDVLEGFNTAPEFGMQGILQEQENAFARAQRAEKEEPEDTEGKDASVPDAKEPDYTKAFAPLNASIQEFGARTDARIADLERMVSESRRQEPPQTQYQQTQYDPEAPVTMAQMMDFQRQLQFTNSSAQEAMLRSEHLRAQLEYERFAKANPDFTSVVSPQQLDDSFKRFIGTDVNRAKSTNWTGHFHQLHAQTAGPRQTQRIADLEKQVAELTKKNESKATMRKVENISPATSRSAASATSRSTAIESPSSGRDLDVTNLTSFKKGKSFKSFANDIKRHMGISNAAV